MQIASTSAGSAKAVICRTGASGRPLTAAIASRASLVAAGLRAARKVALVGQPVGRAQALHLLQGRGVRSASLLVMAADGGKMKVVVTGAGGKTGKLVFEKLLARPQAFEARGAVRSDKSAQELASSTSAPAGSVVAADIAAAAAGGASSSALQDAMAGCDALVIATSAVPKIKPLSIVTMMVKKFFKQEGAAPEFTWKEGQTPEQVDWEGQRVQIDAAKAAGMRKVVLVGSMGGTQPDNMLNKIGDGNILVWKRKAERYLVDSGLDYTIIHPGGLVDEQGGQREIVLGVDDTLLKEKVRNIPRADVAELVVECLTLEGAKNRSFDAITRPAGEGTPTTDFAALLATLDNKTCDYSLP